MLKTHKMICIAITCLTMLGIIITGCSKQEKSQPSISKEPIQVTVPNVSPKIEDRGTIGVKDLTGNDNNQTKREIDYLLNLDDSRYMKFMIINYSSNDIELIFPNTHTFDFILFSDGNVVWDYCKDDPNAAISDWETHQLLKSNGDSYYAKQGYDIWYESFTKELKDGIYNFQFYSTSGKLKDVPHIKGLLEVKDGKVSPKSIILEKK